MAGKRSVRSPLPTAARASEKDRVSSGERWAVTRCRRWGGEAMGQRRDGGAEQRRLDEGTRRLATTTTMDGSATRREHEERKKLQKDRNKAPTSSGCVGIDKGRRKQRIIKSGFRRIGCPRETATRPVILEVENNYRVIGNQFSNFQPGFPSRTVK
uniref:Uncharacterized protein n=1 Tax=Caenorhabditis tropicalis TaxID=1561998 RepID=A0A1I7UJ35_9PELO